MGRWRYDDFSFPPSIPQSVKGGIKAQSKQGAFGKSWWAKRWIQVLEGFNIGARLGRGRSYARKGQVIAITIDKGQIIGMVQGSRPKPYNVTITVKGISPAGWKKLIKVFLGQALFAAKLLAGQMPQDIEKAFKDVKLSLFPSQLKDLHTDCSCPDWSNPCKHIAAVYYLLGEEFDRDPFLLFKLRGLSREELVRLLGETNHPKKKTKGQSRVELVGRMEQEQTEPVPSPEPLPVDLAAFWGDSVIEEGFLGEVQVPAMPASLLKRLGHFPFWRGEERFLDALEPIYAAASPVGLDVVLGECRTGQGKALMPAKPQPRKKS
ncbi:MAG: SWIM zinc finger family protein [Nitrospirota bacterium]|nr:SWIM zinc finger family protein [Nitrospirota bacterium]